MYRVNKLTIQFQLDIGKWGILFAHEIILQSMSHACRLWTIVYRMNILTNFRNTGVRASKVYKIAIQKRFAHLFDACSSLFPDF